MSLQLAAQHLASQGRGPDSMLIHMSPKEVQSLQEIARAGGGSLSVNPETGLVEAGFLKNLLPMIAGMGITAMTGGAAAPWMIGLGVGGLQAARTGSLEKGLMAGLGAYGGSGLMTGLQASAGAVDHLGAQSAAAAGDTTAGIKNLPLSEQLKGAYTGLGTEAGRSAALQSMGGGLNAARTAGMALAPALSDTGEQEAPPSDNEQYNFEFDSGRVDNPDEGYTGAATGERTYFRPKYTRLPNTKVFADGGAVPYNSSGVAFFDDGGSTDDKKELVGIQGAAAAKNYTPFTGNVPFAQPATPQAPAGSIQPVASNPYYTMTGQSADAYKYLMGLGPQPKAPTTPTRPVITDEPVVKETEPVIPTTPTGPTAPTGPTTPVLPPPSTPPTPPSIVTKPIVTDIPDEVDPDTIPLITPTDPLEVETIPTIYTKPIVSDIKDDEVDPDEIPLITPTDPLEVETIPTIYTKPIVTDIPDEVDPNTIPLITPETPLDLPEIPEVPEKTGVVEILPGDAVVPEPVGPRKGGGLDLDEEFDKYLVDPTSDPFGGSGGSSDLVPADPSDFGGVDFGTGFGDGFGGGFSGGVGGGGKYFDDMGNATMAMASGGISGSGNLDLHIPLDFGDSGGFGGKPIPTADTGMFGGQNNTVGGSYGEPYRPDETGGLYKGPMGVPAGLDDSGMGSPEIIARSKANDAARTVGANPASTFDLAKGLNLFANGGLSSAYYNLGGYSDGGRLLRGPGDGVSDSIPATIGNRQPARLADGEFVIPARIVSELGNGSTEAGARKLYAMMDRIQKARRKSVGKGNVARNTRADKHLPA